MLGQPETLVPDAVCAPDHCIVERNYEAMIEAQVNDIRPGLYAELKQRAQKELGASAGKALVARFMARQLVLLGIVPPIVTRLIVSVVEMVRPPAVPEDEFEEDIPF